MGCDLNASFINEFGVGGNVLYDFFRLLYIRNASSWRKGIGSKRRTIERTQHSMFSTKSQKLEGIGSKGSNCSSIECHIVPLLSMLYSIAVCS